MKCESRELNPDPLRDWILSPARLPIPPLSQKVKLQQFEPDSPARQPDRFQTARNRRVKFWEIPSGRRRSLDRKPSFERLSRDVSLIHLLVVLADDLGRSSHIRSLRARRVGSCTRWPVYGGTTAASVLKNSLLRLPAVGDNAAPGEPFQFLMRSLFYARRCFVSAHGNSRQRIFDSATRLPESLTLAPPPILIGRFADRCSWASEGRDCGEQRFYKLAEGRDVGPLVVGRS